MPSQPVFKLLPPQKLFFRRRCGQKFLEKTVSRGLNLKKNQSLSLLRSYVLGFWHLCHSDLDESHELRAILYPTYSTTSDQLQHRARRSNEEFSVNSITQHVPKMCKLFLLPDEAWEPFTPQNMPMAGFLFYRRVILRATKHKRATMLSSILGEVSFCSL